MCLFFQKSENDLVFEEDHDIVLPKHLIITGKSSATLLSPASSTQTNRRGKPSSSSSSSRAHNSSSSKDDKSNNNSRRFSWDLLNDQHRHSSTGSAGDSSRRRLYVAATKPQDSFSGRRTGSLPSSTYLIDDLSRKRVARVSETDDEDLINSGDDAGGSGLPPDFVIPSEPRGHEIPLPGLGRGDSSFEKRKTNFNRKLEFKKTGCF